MELILSTSNILRAGSSDFRRAAKSNAELLESLRSNFESAQELAQEHVPANDGINDTPILDWTSWTKQDEQTLLIPDPKLQHSLSALEGKRDNYDITLKLFFLPSSSLDKREQHVQQALTLVSTELGVTTIDLLILSLPNITFDEDTPSSSTNPTNPSSTATTSTNEITTSWSILESHASSFTISKIGIAEFSSSRLQSLLTTSIVKPAVDQINLRDCCSVPQDLLSVARKNNVELLVHNDCSDILPQGTLRELLGSGPNGAGVLGNVRCGEKVGEKRKTLHGEGPEEDKEVKDGGKCLQGEVLPQWVVKYTAVAKDLGVVESKGYFAMAELVQ